MTEISTSAPQSGDIAAKKEDAVEFTVPGMGSNHCAGLITTSLERLAGVVGVRANIATHSVAVQFDPERTEAATPSVRCG
jgi:Cu+-exporting ATPase